MVVLAGQSVKRILGDKHAASGPVVPDHNCRKQGVHGFPPNAIIADAVARIDGEDTVPHMGTCDGQEIRAFARGAA